MSGLQKEKSTHCITVKQMCECALECGLQTLEEAYKNEVYHADCFYPYDEINDIIGNLNEQMEELLKHHKISDKIIDVFPELK